MMKRLTSFFQRRGYREPVAKVLGTSVSGDTAKTHLRVLRGTPPAAPIAPAGLYDRRTNREVLQLHRLVEHEPKGVLVFETYEPERELPPIGGRFLFRSWWTPDAWSVVTDQRLAWQREVYDASDHEHCLLTWETIETGEAAYRSNEGDWLSVAAYERYVRDDALRIRH